MNGIPLPRPGLVWLACAIPVAFVVGTLVTRQLHGPGSAVSGPGPPSGAGGTDWYSSRLPTGAAAADFTLPGLEQGQEVRLSRFAGHKPVVLLFGSFT